MKTNVVTPSTVAKPAKKRIFKTLDEAVHTKSEAMKKLFANADWSTLKRP